MFFRPVCAVLSAVLLIAADDPPPAEPNPPVPQVLEPYLDEESLFAPGDYGFLRGAFDDASEADKAAYAEYLEWRVQCFDNASAQLRAELLARGYEGSADLVGWSMHLLCRMASTVPNLTDYSSYPAFQEEVARARPIYESYLLAMHNADNAVRSRSQDFGELLKRRSLGEQIIRLGLSWGRGRMEGAPELSPTGLALLRSALGMEMAWHDHDNTIWLKKMVAQHGWPKLSEVGPDASQNAWLLAQHADADPLFQLDALELMEPLMAQDEVSPQNYAYLYDRVMLKLTGQQRYGSQMHCPAGQYEPQPVEDAAALDAYREQASLPPIDQYQAQMLERFGPCTPPPGN